MNYETLPREYQDFDDVAADLGTLGLPPSSKAEYSIDLILDKTAPYRPLYPLSRRELKALYIYLDEA